TSEFVFKKLHIPVAKSGKLRITKFTDMFQVGLEEELQEMASTVSCQLELEKILQPIELSLKGRVENEIFTPRVNVYGLEGYEWLFRHLLAFDPVKVSAGDSFINPMHPLDKVPNLREGQHWRMNRIDLLGNAFKSSLAKIPLLGRTAPAYLDADVTA